MDSLTRDEILRKHQDALYDAIGWLILDDDWSENQVFALVNDYVQEAIDEKTSNE